MKKLILLIFLLISYDLSFGQTIIWIENEAQREYYNTFKNRPLIIKDHTGLLTSNRAKTSRYFNRNFHPITKDLKEKDFNYTLFFNAKNKVDSVAIFFTKRLTYDNGQPISIASLNEIPPIEPIQSQKLKDKIAKIVIKTINEIDLEPGIFEPYILKSITYPGGTAAGETKNLQQYLQYLPDNTKKVDLEGFELTKIPKELYKFKEIENLNLNNNQLQKLKVRKSKFKNLKILTAQNNQISKIKIRKSQKLEVLNVNTNLIDKVPRRFGTTDELWMAANFISKLDKRDYKRLRIVKNLNLYDNNISKLGPEMYLLENLEVLDLYRNNLKFLPEEINQIKNLNTIAASHNNILRIPANLNHLNSLKKLYIHHNRISEIPDDLPESLELLDVGYNLLTEVSEPVLRLKNLKSLDYSNNKVSGDLDFLKELPTLEEIFLFKNDYASTPEGKLYFDRLIKELTDKGIIVR